LPTLLSKFGFFVRVQAMEQVIDGKFACGSCRKTFRWKPEIAGKTGKCSCGASITVPMAAAKPAPKVVVPMTVTPKRVVPVSKIVSKSTAAASIPVPRKIPITVPPVVSKLAIPIPAEPIPADDEGKYDVADDDISQLGALIPTAEAIAAAEREAPPIPAVQIETEATTEAAEPLAYHRTDKAPKTSRSGRINADTGELHDPLREYIVPTILLAAGLAGIAIAVVLNLGTGIVAGFAITAAFIIMLALTLFRTVVVLFAAIPIAAYCDVYVGLLRTAVLKFAAIILFGDVAIMWAVQGLVAVGYVSQKDSGGFGMWIVSWLILTFIYQACVIYLFRIPAVDFKFAFLMSLVAKLANWILLIIIVALITSISLNHPKPTASPYLSARQQAAVNMANTIQSAPMTVQAGQNSPTAMDQMISAQIKANPGRIVEGYTWCRSGLADDTAKKLISDMYNAGANKVYVSGFIMYAELPDNPQKRAACLAVAHQFRLQNGITNDSAAVSLNYQYAVVDMLGERLKKMHH
jgi:hypothetical protein